MGPYPTQDEKSCRLANLAPGRPPKRSPATINRLTTANPIGAKPAAGERGISLVVPAYNERENLPRLVSLCAEALGSYSGRHELILIDDGSTDDSRSTIEKLLADYGHILVPIFHPPGANIGCHPSSLEGFRAASGWLAVFFPADLQILPTELPKFVAASHRADLVASHRVRRADRAWRRHVSRANNRVERWVMGVDVSDAHSSMALTRRALDLVPSVRSRSALIPAEMLMLARNLGLPIGEIEIDHHPRAAGRQTGVKPSEFAGVWLDLIRLRRRLRKGGAGVMRAEEAA